MITERTELLEILKELVDLDGDAGRMGRARAALANAAKIDEWVEWAEKKFRQFNEPEKYGEPPWNPGNGMWAADAKRWATYTPEKKRETARMNLYPPAGTRQPIRY